MGQKRGHKNSDGKEYKEGKEDPIEWMKNRTAMAPRMMLEQKRAVVGKRRYQNKAEKRYVEKSNFIKTN